MSTKDSGALQTAPSAASSIADRTRRALEQYLTVTPDVGQARGAEGIALVTSQSGSEYVVDALEGRCECRDAEYRDPDGGCKHVRRARFALGLDAIPADAAAACDVDPDLGQHCDAELRFAAADGGIIVADDDAELVDEDADRVEGPFPEFNKYGNYTGHEYYRCGDCGTEAMRRCDLEDCCGGCE